MKLWRLQHATIPCKLVVEKHTTLSKANISKLLIKFSCRISVDLKKSGIWCMILTLDGLVVKCYLLEAQIFLVNRYKNMYLMKYEFCFKNQQGPFQIKASMKVCKTNTMLFIFPFISKHMYQGWADLGKRPWINFRNGVQKIQPKCSSNILFKRSQHERFLVWLFLFSFTPIFPIFHPFCEIAFIKASMCHYVRVRVIQRFFKTILTFLRALLD